MPLGIFFVWEFGLMVVFVKVCGVGLVAMGMMKQFVVKDLEVLVVNLGGRFFCLDGRCTHAGAPLAEGVLKGEVLTCPWHGSQFRVADGAVLRGPAERALKSYRVEVRDEAVFVEL
jgi:nitrite reductase/ring-hydroxylating ferredoxin subunit